MTTSVGEDFPKEQERVRELVEAYVELGPAGRFAAIALRDVLKRAEIAAMSWDPVEVIRSYKELVRCA